MDINQIQKRYKLATSEDYQEIKQELLKFVINASVSSLSAEKIQGMLILLNEPENWIKEYFRELENRHKHK